MGDSDAQPRWFGLAPLRIVLAGLGLASVADAVLRPGGRWWEWLVAALAVGGGLPAPASRSWAQVVGVEIRYRTRRRLRWITVKVRENALDVSVHGARRVWCYNFSHHGRLDLAKRDVVLADRLARMVESLAAAGQPAHVAMHVETLDADQGSVRTVLSVTVPSLPPPEWRRDPLAGIAGTLRPGRSVIVERREYVRTSRHVLRTLRVASFSPGREASALEALSENVQWLTVSLHASIIPAVRARRLTARAVHRLGSDAQLTRGAGFRWSARHEWELEAYRQRENSVAAGAALCQWALYAVVRASSIEQLRRRVARTTEVAQSAGLRLEAGAGEQGDWFVWQLPGGPGW